MGGNSAPSPPSEKESSQLRLEKKAAPKEAPPLIDSIGNQVEQALARVDAARKSPTLAPGVLETLESLLPRTRGTAWEPKVREGIDVLSTSKATLTEERFLNEVRDRINRGEFAQAQLMIKSHLADPDASLDFTAALSGLRTRIRDLAPAKYEELLTEARKLAESGQAAAARERVLKAVSWGVSEVTWRAKMDGDAFLRPAKLPAEDPRGALEKHAREAWAETKVRTEELESAGKIAEAISECERFSKEFRETAAWDLMRERLEQLQEVLAAAKPAPPALAKKELAVTGKPETKAAPSSPATISTAAPRPGAIKPGALSEQEKQRMFSDLAAIAGKEQKGSKKAAAARRAEWLAGLEKELGIYDVTTIQDKGDVAKRVDIVIVSAGFPKSEYKKVNQLAEALKNSLLKVDPFQNYPDYINFHRVNVDDPSPTSAHVHFTVQQNILTCDRRLAIEYAKAAPSYDLVVVLCNVKNVRSTGGPPVITIDADLNLGRTFLHEMGHAFASLNDEYVDPGMAMNRPFQDNDEDEWCTNVTSQKNPKLCRWHYWLTDTWPVAYDVNKLLPAGHKIGCFEGGALQSKGVFRPEPECLMRMGDKYCVVCFEQVEKKFYRLIAPIDDARPHRTTVGAWIDESVTLEADAIRTAASGGERIGKFEGFWYVDGKLRHSNARNLTTVLTLNPSELGAGVHEAGVRVDFSNRRIRRDDGWLSSSAGWKLDIVRYKRPKWEGPGQVPAKVGVPIAFDARIENPDAAAFRVEVKDLPEGAAYENGKVTWTPEKSQQGAWRPRFLLTDGVRTVEKTVEISVLDPSEKNFDPVFPVLEPRVVKVGEALDLTLEVIDVDGDNLVFTSPNLPEGAELDVYGGVLRWKPTARQAGNYPGITIEVFDGRRRVKGNVDLIVEDKAGFQGAQELPYSLRSPDEATRAAAIGDLASLPKVTQFLEEARLLRDKMKEVRSTALAALKNLQEGADEAFLGMMVKDLVPHAWDFTDHREILEWLDALASKASSSDSDAKALKSALRAIDKYNKDRSAP
jgi:hypothetical protein